MQVESNVVAASVESIRLESPLAWGSTRAGSSTDRSEVRRGSSRLQLVVTGECGSSQILCLLVSVVLLVLSTVRFSPGVATLLCRTAVFESLPLLVKLWRLVILQRGVLARGHGEGCIDTICV